MRFYMIDRVVSYKPWKSIHAQKLTSQNEIAGWAGAVGAHPIGANLEAGVFMGPKAGVFMGPAEVFMGPKAGVNPAPTILGRSSASDAVPYCRGWVYPCLPSPIQFAPMGAHPAPTMPSALVLEALCQAGSWLLLLSSELRQRAALLSIGSVTYIREVELGAVLEIEGYVVGSEREQAVGSAQGTIPTAPAKNEMAVFSGRVLVQGMPVLEANEIMCVLIDAQDLEDPEDTARMKHLLLQGGKES